MRQRRGAAQGSSPMSRVVARGVHRRFGTACRVLTAAAVLLIAWIIPQLDLGSGRSPWKTASAGMTGRGELRWEKLPVPARARERARAFGEYER